MYINLFTAATSNGRRAAIALEECGLPYRIHKIDLYKGEQRSPEFLKLNPAGMIPVLVDPQGSEGREVIVSQSNAILLYAAEKSGKHLPNEIASRTVVFQWLMQAIADVASSSAALFLLTNTAPDKTPSNIEFFLNRLLTALRSCDERLQQTEYLGGAFSVADISLYPTIAARLDAVRGAKLRGLTRWAETVGSRPAVQRGMESCT